MRDAAGAVRSVQRPPRATTLCCLSHADVDDAADAGLNLDLAEEQSLASADQVQAQHEETSKKSESIDFFAEL